MQGKDDVIRALHFDKQTDVCGFWRTLATGAACYVVVLYVGFLTSASYSALVAGAFPADVLNDNAVGQALGENWLHHVEDTGRSLAVVVQALVGIGFLYFVVRPRCFRMKDYFGPLLPSCRLFLKYALCLLVLVAACCALAVIISLLRGKASSAKFTVPASPDQLPLWLVSIAIAGPLYEELLFRGFLFKGIECSWAGKWGALLITTVLFAASHFQYYLPLPAVKFSAISIFSVSMWGLFFGWARLKTGSTGLAIALHALHNAIAAAMMLVAL